MQDVELGVDHSALGCSRCTVTTIGHVDHRMRALSISVCRAGTHACQRLLEAAPAKAWRQGGPVVRNLRTRMRRAREQGRLQRTSGACALHLGATCPENVTVQSQGFFLLHWPQPTGTLVPRMSGSQYDHCWTV